MENEEGGVWMTKCQWLKRAMRRRVGGLVGWARRDEREEWGRKEMKNNVMAADALFYWLFCLGRFSVFLSPTKFGRNIRPL